jgi:hypothetical protein
LNVDTINKSINEAQAFSTNLKNDHDKRLADLFSRIQQNNESIRKLNKQIDDHKHFQDMMITKTETIASRLAKTKENFLDELKSNKNELTLKI